MADTNIYTTLLGNMEKHRGKPQFPNQYHIQLGVPKPSGSDSVTVINASPSTGMLTASAITPERGFNTKEYSYYGISRKLPISRTYGMFSLGFVIDDYMAISSWIEYWMDLIINPFSDFIEDYSPVVSSGYVKLIPVNRSDFESGTYKFLEAYPTKILPLDFNMSKRNELMTYTVEFNCREYEYDFWTYKTSNRTPGSR